MVQVRSQNTEREEDSGIQSRAYARGGACARQGYTIAEVPSLLMIHIPCVEIENEVRGAQA